MKDIHYLLYELFTFYTRLIYLVGGLVKLFHNYSKLALANF